MTEYRQLHEADKQVLLTFLGDYIETSMFLISNALKVGLEDHGERYQGTYIGAFENGDLCAVVGHFWNGILLTQSPTHQHLESLVPMALEKTGRDLFGMTGEIEQVNWIRERFAKDREALLDSPELLYALSLDALQVPPLLNSEKAIARLAKSDELEFLTEWRLAYRFEALHEKNSEELEKQAGQDIISLHKEGVLWVLEVEGELVAMTAFNAQIPQCVQVGGVYTPPALRGKSYARSALAGSLLKVREQGVGRSILFTPEDNFAAQACYQKLGYKEIGQYSIVLFG